MKKINILLAFICVFSLSNAQEMTSRVVLSKGEKITINSTMNSTNSQSMMGGEPMEMKSDMKSTTVLEVMEVKDTFYVLKQVLTKMTMNFDGFGQKMTYDSESKEKQDNPFITQLAEKIGKPDTIQLAMNGKLIEESKPAKEGKGEGKRGGGRGMMRMMNSGGSAENAFLIIPKDAIEKGSWEEMSEKDGLTTRKKFTLGGVMGNMATVTVQSQTKGDIDMNRGGMAMTSKINTLSEEMYMVDISTGRVQMHSATITNNSKTLMNGNESPSTGKTTVTSSFE